MPTWQVSVLVVAWPALLSLAAEQASSSSSQTSHQKVTAWAGPRGQHNPAVQQQAAHQLSYKHRLLYRSGQLPDMLDCQLACTEYAFSD